MLSNARRCQGRTARPCGARRPAPGGDCRVTSAFLQRYYRRVSPEDLIGRDPVDVLGAAFSHRRAGAERPQGTARVRVFTPTVEEHGWASRAHRRRGRHRRHAVPGRLGAAELAQEGRSIHLVVHPQLDRASGRITGELVERPRQPADERHAGGGLRVVDPRRDRPASATRACSASRDAGCAGCCPTSASRSRTGPRCARPPAGRRDVPHREPAAGRPGGRGGRGPGAARLAGRRPLHVPRGARVRPAGDRR